MGYGLYWGYLARRLRAATVSAPLRAMRASLRPCSTSRAGALMPTLRYSLPVVLPDKPFPRVAERIEIRALRYAGEGQCRARANAALSELGRDGTLAALHEKCLGRRRRPEAVRSRSRPPPSALAVLETFFNGEVWRAWPLLWEGLP